MKLIKFIKDNQMLLYIMAFQIFTFFVTDPKSPTLLYVRIAAYVIMDLILFVAIRKGPQK